MIELRVNLGFREGAVEIFFSLIKTRARFEFDDFYSIEFAVILVHDLAHLRKAPGTDRAQVVELRFEPLS